MKKSEEEELITAICVAGILLFASGMCINIHSDSILRNLRKPGEKGYKIPKGIIE